MEDELETVSSHDDAVQDEVVRRFIRHPSDFPISYTLGEQSEISHKLRDVSCGGLCFMSDVPVNLGETVHIHIPIESPGFDADGVVAWCRPEADHFAVGIAFESDATAFSVRMVEQVCHIEHYRAEVLHNEGRKLSSEEAAQEWVEKFAGDFPGH